MARVLGIVPARAGSKRLPGKNRMELGGKALWNIAVEQALEAGCDTVTVSTDDHLIHLDREIVWRPGVCFLNRPQELAQDNTPVEKVISHVLSLEGEKHYDAICLLNPTHPLRKVEDIRACIEDVTERGYPSSTLCWKDYHYTLPEGSMLGSMNEQDRIPRIVVSGECYVVRVPAFIEFQKLMIYGNVNRGHSRISSGPRIDIDTEEDFLCAQALWGRK